MKTTTTARSQRVDPPPDPLWFPDAVWPGPVTPEAPWRDDHGGEEAGGAASGAAGWDSRESSGGGSGGGSSGGADAGSVFSADPCGSAATGRSSVSASASGVPAGLSGSLRLGSVVSLDQEFTGSALQGLRMLGGWAAAAQARLIHRQHKLMAEELERFNEECAARDAARGRPAVVRAVDRPLAFSLTATEIATMLGIPEGTAKVLVEESDELCERCPDTLALLEHAEISPAQARTILDQTRSLVAEESPELTGPEQDPESPPAQGRTFPPGAARALEAELLKVAPGLTNAQLLRKARRLRERSYPESIPVRHRTAFEQRRVWFQPQPDGMGHLTAYLPADKGQSIFGALTGAARG